jgi:predicted transcriptional regulator
VSTTNGDPSHAPGQHRPLLISVQPRFAEAILDGSKTVELRRTRVAAPEGSLLILYATAPTMAVVGLVTLDQRDTDLPNSIWRRYRRHMGLRRDEFDAYLVGAHQATALTLREPRRLSQTYPLAALRDEAPFSPPQSYRYIAPADPRSLRQLVAH